MNSFLLDRARIIVGDCRQEVKKLDPESVHQVMTSPPYFGLRDYKSADQIGLEPNPEDYVASLVQIMRDLRPALRDDGTLWLNLGDSYAGGGSGSRDSGKWPKQSRNDHKTQHAKARTGLADKQLIGIPWRVALALQADGWILRQDIIWAKPNPMPESVKDRCTRAHEYLFMFSKSARYFYDADAIAEPAIYHGLVGQDESGFKNPANYDGKTAAMPDVRNQRSDKQRGHSKRHAGFNDRWDQMTKAEQMSGMRNKRSVWTIATQPFPEAHFATMPPKLAEQCILAGCPAGGTVLDPFGGAGTTALAATRNDRRAILIELNAEYADIARRRLANGVASDAPERVETEPGMLADYL